MKNNNNEQKSINFNYLEYDINSRITLFKKLLDGLADKDKDLKTLGYEIIDSKILLDLLNNNLKKKSDSDLLRELLELLFKEVNRYSEFEKYLRKNNYDISYNIDYNSDDNILNSLRLTKSEITNCTNLNDFLNKTNLLKSIISSKIQNKDIKEYDKYGSKLNLINVDVKDIYSDFTNISMDDEHFKQLQEIISLRKKVFELLQLANFYNLIANYNFDTLVLRENVTNKLYLFVADCSKNLLNIDDEIDKNIDKIKDLIVKYKSKKMSLEDNETYDIYSDIEIPKDMEELLEMYYEMYENTIENNDLHNISFLTFLKMAVPYEKDIIKLVSALTEQFNTIYTEYLIYKTPNLKNNVNISFEQFAKIKYGINSINQNYIKNKVSVKKKN